MGLHVVRGCLIGTDSSTRAGGAHHGSAHAARAPSHCPLASDLYSAFTVRIQAHALPAEAPYYWQNDEISHSPPNPRFPCYTRTAICENDRLILVPRSSWSSVEVLNRSPQSPVPSSLPERRFLRNGRARQRRARRQSQHYDDAPRVPPLSSPHTSSLTFPAHRHTNALCFARGSLRLVQTNRSTTGDRLRARVCARQGRKTRRRDGRAV